MMPFLPEIALVPIDSVSSPIGAVDDYAAFCLEKNLALLRHKLREEHNPEARRIIGALIRDMEVAQHALHAQTSDG